jgi:hypothetical protein
LLVDGFVSLISTESHFLGRGVQGRFSEYIYHPFTPIEPFNSLVEVYQWLHEVLR